MKKIENRKKEIKDKMASLEKKRDDYYGKTAEIENQLVMVALEPYAYSIENFDMSEKGRLMAILRKGNGIMFDWYVKKKQEGFEFGQFEPLHKILKEDYENFYNCYKEEK